MNFRVCAAIRWMVGFELETLGEYVETMDEVLASRQTDFQNRLDRQTAAMPPEERAEFLELQTDDAFWLLDRLPRLTWDNAFVSIYSRMEQALIGLCRRDQIERGDTSALGKQGIFTAQGYWLGLDVDFPEGLMTAKSGHSRSMHTSSIGAWQVAMG